MDEVRFCAFADYCTLKWNSVVCPLLMIVTNGNEIIQIDLFYPTLLSPFAFPDI